MEADTRKMEAQLQLWDPKIDAIAIKAAKTGRATSDLHYHVDDLKVKRAAVQARLDELRATEGGKREGVNASLETAWNELEAAVEDLGL